MKLFEIRLLFIPFFSHLYATMEKNKFARVFN